MVRVESTICCVTIMTSLRTTPVWGSNSSTAKEAAKEIAQAEADRTTLIAIINPRAIPQGHPVPAKIGPADS
jgi:hypothetical protein